ncbi:alpha/beta fold hydrolase [Natronoarchaeum philippinense]|nr:alpha/beta hydrolase [Natronoarchaeum philippinense]
MPLRSPGRSTASSTSDGDRPASIVVEGDRQLAYTEYGRPDGAPVVFLHGTPGSRRIGALFDAAARDCGVRLIAPDRPGYGRSDPWPDRSVVDTGLLVDDLLDGLDIPTAGLVAFSGGAPYALAAAARTDRIDRLDIVSGATPPSASEATPRVQRLLAGLASTTPSVLGGLFRGQAWLAQRLGPSVVVDQYTTDGIDEPISEDAEELVRADFVEAFARHRSGAITEFRHTADDWGVDFDAVDAAVDLWHGDADTNVPIEDARRFATQIPTAQVRALDGADHLRALLRAVPKLLDEHR